MAAPEGRTQLCHWDEESQEWKLIWIRDVDAHLEDERYENDQFPVDGECPQ